MGSLSGSGTQVASKRETPKDKPFLIPLAEGIDAESAGEIFALDRVSALEDTVIIHDLVLAQGRRITPRRQCWPGLVSSSNLFVFGKPCPAKKPKVSEDGPRQRFALTAAGA
jgi:hypothetical protein